jgi:hypothetical protein
LEIKDLHTPKVEFYRVSTFFMFIFKFKNFYARNFKYYLKHEVNRKYFYPKIYFLSTRNIPPCLNKKIYLRSFVKLEFSILWKSSSLPSQNCILWYLKNPIARSLLRTNRQNHWHEGTLSEKKIYHPISIKQFLILNPKELHL